MSFLFLLISWVWFCGCYVLWIHFLLHWNGVSFCYLQRSKAWVLYYLNSRTELRYLPGVGGVEIGCIAICLFVCFLLLLSHSCSLLCDRGVEFQGLGNASPHSANRFTPPQPCPLVQNPAQINRKRENVESVEMSLIVSLNIYSLSLSNATAWC